MTQDQTSSSDSLSADDAAADSTVGSPKPSRLRRRLIFLAILVLIGGIITLGEYRFSTGDASGMALSGPAPAQTSAQTPARDTYRIATFNIHSGKGRATTQMSCSSNRR
jgi:hypothetical protein